MTPAERVRAGLAVLIAETRSVEQDAYELYLVTGNEAAWDKATVAEAEAAREQWERIRQARQALEWEITQVPDQPCDRGAGVTP